MMVHLPPELWTEVIGHLCFRPRRLARLARCNKQLHQLVLPVLYKNVRLGSDDGEEDEPWNNLLALTKTVLTRPHIARLVRSLNLNDAPRWDGCPEWETPDESHFEDDAEPDPIFRTVVQQRLPISDELREQWGSALKSSEPLETDAITALLLAFLPSLEDLEMTWSDDGMFVPLVLSDQLAGKQLLLSPNSPQIILGKLEMLKIGQPGLDPVDMINSVGLLGRLRIPSLTHLFGGSQWGHIFKITNGEEIVSREPLESSALEHLELRDACLGSSNLDELVKPCHRLKTFIYHRRWNFEYDNKLIATDITTALQPARESLESVWLTHEFPSFDDVIAEEVNPLDWSGFSSLETLFIAPWYLIRDPERTDMYADIDPVAYNINAKRPVHERLPPSLEVLRVLSIDSESQIPLILVAFRDMIQHRAEFPALRELCIEAAFGDRGADFGIPLLTEEALQVGVELRIVDVIADEGAASVMVARPESERKGDYAWRRPKQFSRDWGMEGEYEWEHPVPVSQHTYDPL